MKRTCIHCGRAGGKGPRELRPYGPGGSDVCAECTFNGPPDRLAQAKKLLGRQLAATGPVILDDTEEVGPRSMTPTRPGGDEK